MCFLFFAREQRKEKEEREKIKKAKRFFAMSVKDRRKSVR
jgi:hypothetical protein